MLTCSRLRSLAPRPLSPRRGSGFRGRRTLQGRRCRRRWPCLRRRCGAGGGDQTYLGAKDAVNGRGDQGIVGATEHDGVDTTLHDGLEVTSRHPFELGAIDDAAFDHGHELGAGLLVDLDSRIEGVHGAPVRAACRGQRSREYADAPVTRLLHRRPRPWFYYTYYRHLEGSLSGPEG